MMIEMVFQIKSFELRGIGDVLLRNVNEFTGLGVTGSTIELTIDANIADWIKNIDLTSVGFDHSASANNVQVADNTNDETVFTMNQSLNLEENVIKRK